MGVSAQSFTAQDPLQVAPGSCLAAHPDVVAEGLPAYAPQLNPDEWVRGWVKYGWQANLAVWDADELREWVADALIDLKFRPDFVTNTELPLAEYMWLWPHGTQSEARTCKSLIGIYSL